MRGCLAAGAAPPGKPSPAQSGSLPGGGGQRCIAALQRHKNAVTALLNAVLLQKRPLLAATDAPRVAGQRLVERGAHSRQERQRRAARAAQHGSVQGSKSAGSLKLQPTGCKALEQAGHG